MGVLEALVLFFLGLTCGVLSTMFDILVIGAESFLAHFALWVLVNAILAVHLENRLTAIWWAIPFNLGFVESYFIATVASYECYTKSLAVPLAAIALISPFLTNAIWEAKRDKGAFGKALSAGIVVATLVASYLINGALSAYDWVVCALLALLLLVVPVRRLSISPAKRPEPDESSAEQLVSANASAVGAELEGSPRKGSAEGTPREPTKRRGRSFGFGRNADKANNDKPERRTRAAEQAASADEGEERKSLRPTKRRGGGVAERVAGLSSRRRRKELEREDRMREERVRETSERSARRSEQGWSEPGYEGGYAYDEGAVSTLGTARAARPSVRNRR